MGDDSEIEEGEQDSPWSRGGSGKVPVPTEPLEFSWTTDHPVGDHGKSSANPSLASTGEAVADPALIVTESSMGGPTASPERSGDPGSRRPSTRLVAVAGVAALAAVVGLLTIVRDDSATEPGNEAQTSTTGVTQEDLAPSTELPEVEEPAIESSVPPTTTGRVSSVPEPEREPLVWQAESMDVPERIGQFTEAMTLVTLAADGIFREIDLPSGDVRSIDLGKVFTAVPLAAGRGSTLIVKVDGEAMLLAAGQPPIEVELDGESGQFRSRPSRDEFVGIVFEDVPPDYRSISVLPDGSSVVTEQVDDPGRAILRGLYAPNGDLLVDDAGGVYQVRDDGAVTRISDGYLIAASAKHLLFRECSAVYECAYVLDDVATGERTGVTIAATPTDLLRIGAVAISPDGAHILHRSFGGDSVTEIISDLATGETLIVDAGLAASRIGLAWAADSSGVFGLSESAGLEFVDRLTGDVTMLGESFGRMESFGVRERTTESQADLAPPSSGLRIVGIDREGSIHNIDIDSGDFTTIEGPPLGSSAPAFLYPDADGVTVTSYDFVRSVRLDYAGDAPKLLNRLEPTGLAIAGPLPGTVWQQREDSLLDLVDAYGQSLGPTIAIPPGFGSAPIGSDGRGGVLLASSLGGVYTANPESVERITTGELLAAGSTAAYVRECDDQFRCGVARVDRATGDRLLLDTSAFDSAGVDSSVGGVAGSSVSPDGDVALILVGGLGTTWTVIDTVATTTLAVPSVASGTAFAWSADSQYGLYLSGDVLHLYNRASNSVRVLGAHPKLRAFAVIPADVANTPAPVAIDRPPDGTTEALVVGPARFPF